MLSFSRFVSRKLPVRIVHINSRAFAAQIKLDVETNLEFPRCDEKFARYLNYLSKNTDNKLLAKKNHLLHVIIQKNAYRKSIYQQMLELSEMMAKECNDELLSLAKDEYAVCLAFI